MAAAARALVGSDSCAQMSSRERARGGERMQRVREKSEGTRGVIVALLGGAGEPGGGRGSVGARHAPVCPPGRGGR